MCMCWGQCSHCHSTLQYDTLWHFERVCLLSLLVDCTSHSAVAVPESGMFYNRIILIHMSRWYIVTDFVHLLYQLTLHNALPDLASELPPRFFPLLLGTTGEGLLNIFADGLHVLLCSGHSGVWHVHALLQYHTNAHEQIIVAAGFLHLIYTQFSKAIAVSLPAKSSLCNCSPSGTWNSGRGFMKLESSAIVYNSSLCSELLRMETHN